MNNQLAGTPQSLTTAYKSLLSLGATTGATTLRRVWLTEVEWGATDIPNATDCPIMMDISRFTAAGTGTTITPNPTDTGGGEAAALGTYLANFTAEPTIAQTASVFFKAINQRASDKQWWRDKTSCPISPAVTANGLAMRVKSTNYASTCGGQAQVEE